MRLQGIGPTTASAFVSTIGDGRDFRNGRQVAAWLGLVPGQYSSGGKTRLGRITKAGDRYLRTLLMLGARAVLAAAPAKRDRLSRWAIALAARRGYWKAVVAIAGKECSHGLGSLDPRRELQTYLSLRTLFSDHRVTTMER